jgi:hypothetical protein
MRAQPVGIDFSTSPSITFVIATKFKGELWAQPRKPLPPHPCR